MRGAPQLPAENDQITQAKATALGVVLNMIRPRWAVQSFVTLVGKNLAWIPGYAALAQASITVANDPTKDTPAIIFMEGSHWNHFSADRRPPAGPACEDHPEQTAMNCRCCWADVKVGQRPETHIGKRYNHEEGTA